MTKNDVNTEAPCRHGVMLSDNECIRCECEKEQGKDRGPIFICKDCGSQRNKLDGIAPKVCGACGCQYFGVSV